MRFNIAFVPNLADLCYDLQSNHFYWNVTLHFSGQPSLVKQKDTLGSVRVKAYDISISYLVHKLKVWAVYTTHTIFVSTLLRCCDMSLTGFVSSSALDPSIAAEDSTRNKVHARTDHALALQIQNSPSRKPPTFHLPKDLRQLTQPPRLIMHSNHPPRSQVQHINRVLAIP